MAEKLNLIKTIMEGMDYNLHEIEKHLPPDLGGMWDPAFMQRIFSGFWHKAYDAQQNGDPIAWINFGIPTELFYAMDIVPIPVDHISANASVFGLTYKYNDLAKEKIADYLCSNNTLLLGALLSGDVDPPAIMVHPANPCDSNLATYPTYSKYFDYPYFMIDMPYITTEKSLDYVANEYKKLIVLLEEKTGRKLDLDKLRQTMEYSNTTHENVLKLNALREAVPAPYSSWEVMGECGLLLSCVGTPELAEYFEKRHAHIKAMVDRGQGHMTPEEEKIRVVWIYGAPVFDYGIYDWGEKEHGAVLVSQMNNNFINEPVEDITNLDSILRGLARKLVLMPMTRECGGPWENYLDNSLDLIKRYKADAAIFGGNHACKSNWAIAKLVKDKIQEEVGIPVCNIELDLFDDRIASSDTIKAQMSQYFDLMLTRKERR